ncbi:MAG: FHA domain-containing protein [Myxococcota bacterium]|jgi:hypothetical protein|nr:FHA domain-containing protein [Myxococcota bacterium]
MTWPTRIARLLPALLLLVGIPDLGARQAQAATGARLTIDHLDVAQAPEYRIYADYLDAAGRPQPALDLRQLRILLDGEPFDGEVVIQPFHETPEPLAFVLLVNNYRGYESVFAAQRRALTEFVRRMRPQDLAAVVWYADEVRSTGYFSSDEEELLAQLAAVPPPEKPREVFLDALLVALDLFPRNDPAFPRRRALVLVSDALDQGLADPRSLARRVQKEIAPRARALDVEFHGLGLSLESKEGLRLMAALARHSGGSYREVAATEVSRLDQHFRRLQQQIAGQYVIGFADDDLDPEVPHTLQLAVNDRGALVESTPREFYTRPVAGTPWWAVLLVGAGALGLAGLLGLFVLVIVRRRRQAAEDEEPVPGRACPVCGEELGFADRVCQSCLETPHVAELVQVGGADDGFVYVLQDDVNVIGSSEGDIVIPDPTVSRRHARIEVASWRFELADFDSTNGTYVNGQRIRRQFLRDGDQVKFGNVDLTFRLA